MMNTRRSDTRCDARHVSAKLTISFSVDAGGVPVLDMTKPV